jgi:hypothetical protein
LNWNAGKLGGAAWLSLNPASGSGVTPTSPGTLNLTANPAGLAPGTYTEWIRLSSSTPNVANSPLTVNFTLQVFDQLSDVYLPIVSGGGGGSSSSQVAALVIGIADYQHLGPPPPGIGELPEVWGYDLSAPFYDVRDMIDYLLKWLKISLFRIIQRTEKAATWTSIRGNVGQSSPSAAALSAFQELDQIEDENTLVIIYYSGHGGQTPDLNGDESDGYDEFIAAYDTNLGPNGFERVITDDDLQVLLATLESKHIVIIIDACFSGGLTGAGVSSAGVGGLRPRGLVNPSAPGVTSAQGGMSEIAGPGRVVLTGSTGNQLTWESVELQNGVFTYFLLQGLQDALYDTNQNRRVSAEEAYWFSRDAVDDFIYSRQREHQNPAISDQRFGQVDLTWLP